MISHKLVGKGFIKIAENIQMRSIDPFSASHTYYTKQLNPWMPWNLTNQLCDCFQPNVYLSRKDMAIYNQIWEKPPSMHTTSRHTFHHQMIVYSLTNSSARYWWWKLPRLLLLWLVSEACQASTSARFACKWFHIPLTSRLPAVIHHMTGWWVLPWI